GPWIWSVAQRIPNAARVEAVLALARLGPGARAAVPLLSEMMASPDAADRCLAAELLGGIGAPAKPAVPAPRQALKGKERAGRAAAAGALSRLDRDAVEAIPVLVAALTEEICAEELPGPHIEALARFGRPAVPALIRLLKERDRVYRLTEPFGVSIGH